VDITEIIQHQHDEQRRGFAQLEEWPRDDVEGLAAVWERLAVLLETHAAAEERYFYPHLLDLGTGAADADSAEEEVEDAVKDHNDLRAAIRRVAAEEVGSAAWWTAVVDANTENSDHMGEEERQDLADFRQQATLELRHDIAVDFLRFQALNARTGVTPEDTDAETYARTRSTGTGEGARPGAGESLKASSS
jgi:hypothetical protein